MILKDLIPVLPKYNNGKVEHYVEVHFIKGYRTVKDFVRDEHGYCIRVDGKLQREERQVPNYEHETLYELMEIRSRLLNKEVASISLGSHYDDDIKLQIRLKE